MTKNKQNSLVKFLSGIALTISLVLITSTAFLPLTAQAGCLGAVPPDSNCGDALAKLFSSGDQPVVTFTDFKGDLAAPNAQGYAKGLTQATDARTYILNVTNFVLGFLGLAAVVVVIYGGVLTVTSAGNPEGAGKGKKAITYAAIGLLVVMSSFALVNTILLAPSGSEKGSSGGAGSTTSLRGVAGNQRFSYLASKMEALAVELKTAVNYHNNLAITLSSLQADLVRIYQPLDTYCDDAMTAANNCDDWNQGLEAKINSYKIAALNAASALQNYASSPTATLKVQTQLAPVIDKLKLVNLAYSKARDKAAGNGCLGSGNCTDNDAKDVFNAFKANLGDNGHPSDSGSVNTSFFPKTLVKESLQESTTSIDLEVQKIRDLLAGISSAGIAGDKFTLLLSDLTQIGGYDMSDDADKQTAINKTVDALGTFAELIDILKNIKNVDVALASDVITGNAPLIANFSSVGSSDPSGLAITDDRIQWNLNGDGKTFGAIPDDTTYINCKPTGATASCTFLKPGTYRVILTINPSAAEDPINKPLKYNQELAPGVAYIDIKVNPASTKINLISSLKDGTNPTNLISYDSTTGLIKEDVSIVKYTIGEAKAGIQFNATSTTLPDGTSKILEHGDEAKIRWNFGTKSDYNDLLQTPSAGALQLTQSFPAGGSYPVRFEVIDKNGVVDRKLFTVEVSDVAPRISNAPTTSKIGQEVIYDGSNSTSEGGKAIIFNWTIVKEAVATPASPIVYFYQNNKLFLNNVAHAFTDVPPTNLDPTKRTGSTTDYDCAMPDGKDDILKCTFKRAGKYKVTLDIVDKTTAKHYTQSSETKITSNPPNAGIQISPLTKNAPALYKLDGKVLSFDPDETDNTNLEYSWEVNPNNCVVIGQGSKSSDSELIAKGTDGSSDQKSCDTLKEFNKDNSQPVVKFTKKGDYTANLVVRSIDEQDNPSKPVDQPIKVDNLLDLSWGDMKPSAVLAVPGATGSTTPDQLPSAVNTQPVATVNFIFNSSQAVSYDLDFGDGITKSGDFSKTITVPHNYDKTGKFAVKLTVYDPDNVENSLTRNVFIGDGNTPVAILTTKINGNEIEPSEFTSSTGTKIENVIVVSRKDNITFDAEKSINTDGTGRRLQYAWNINDNEKQSTSKSVSYQFDTLSGDKPYVVKLKATNEKDATQFGEDSVNIMVVGQSPILRSVTAVPQGSDLTTPVTVNLSAVGATDPDGQIVQYKWWYYVSQPGGVPSPDNRLGVQITSSPTATLTLGTHGETGTKVKYLFGVELTDNDNNVVSTDAQNDSQKLKIVPPTVEVVNGPNKAPIAKFTVDRSSVNVNEPVNFTSASNDPDKGDTIATYLWDFGDGSKGDNKPNVSHTYTKANVDGYKVKLSVTDSNASTSVSDPVRIFVDAVAGLPTAAFTTTNTPGSKTVQFDGSGSTADTNAGAKLTKYTWDFDVNVDSNGDGIKDNDTDSGDLKPTHDYPDFGIYRAKLTVQDDQGQSKSVTNFVNVKTVAAPTPAPSSSSSGGSSGSGSGKTITFLPGPATSSNLSMGANVFAASNQVDPRLLVGSLIAYAILLTLAYRANKQKTE